MANRTLITVLTILFVSSCIIADSRTVYLKLKSDAFEARGLHFAEQLGTVVRNDPKFEAYYVRINNSLSEEYLNTLAEVDFAEDLTGTFHLGDVTPDDVRFGDQWYMTKLNIPELWGLVPWDQTTAKNITVAICDQGYIYNHEDFDNSKIVYQWDYNNFDADPTDPSTDYHGVHVTGIIEAATNNGKGIAGLAYGANIMIGRVADEKRTISIDSLQFCLDDAYAQGVDIVNLSLYGTTDYTSLENKINTYTSEGMLIVVCAGNAYQSGNPIGYPAGYASAFTVTNIDENDQRYPASNVGDYIDIAAPGTNIWSLDGNNGYRSRTGCSMATPVVTGIAALMKAIKPELTPVQLMDLLTSTAVDLGDPGKDSTFGWGRIDPVKAAKQLLNQPPAINANSAYNIVVGQPFSVELSCSSIESFDSCTSLTYDTAPSFLTVTTNSVSSFTVSGTASSGDIGTYNMVLSALDTYNTLNSFTTRFIVSEVPVPITQDPPTGSQTPSAGSEPTSEPTTGNNEPTVTNVPSKTNGPSANTPQSKGPVSKPVISGVSSLSVSILLLVISFVL